MDDIFKGLDLAEEAQTTLAERIEEAKKGWIEGAQNDPAFIDKIRNETSGKFFASAEKAIKRSLNVSPDDIDKDISGLKKLEAMIKAGVSGMEKNKDTTNQELQDQLLKLKAEYDDFKDEKVPAMLSEERTKHQMQYIEDGIFKDCTEFETVCKADVRPSLVDAYLIKNNLKKVWDDEAKRYDFRTLDNLKPTLNDKPLGTKDIIENALEYAGVLVKSNGTPTPPGTPPGTPPKRTGKLSANAEAMMASFGVK